MLVLKFAVTAYTGLYFWRWLWPNWLNFIRSFKKIRYMTEKKTNLQLIFRDQMGKMWGHICYWSWIFC